MHLAAGSQSGIETAGREPQPDGPPIMGRGALPQFFTAFPTKLLCLDPIVMTFGQFRERQLLRPLLPGIASLLYRCLIGLLPAAAFTDPVGADPAEAAGEEEGDSRRSHRQLHLPPQHQPQIPLHGHEAFRLRSWLNSSSTSLLLQCPIVIPIHVASAPTTPYFA